MTVRAYVRESTAREGIGWLSDHGLTHPDGYRWPEWWSAWTRANELVWVVEFELVDRFCCCGAKIITGKGGLVTTGIMGTVDEVARQEWRCCAACVFEPTGCACRLERGR